MTRSAQRMGEARVNLEKAVCRAQVLLSENMDALECAPHHWSYVHEKLRRIAMYCDDLASASECAAQDLLEAQSRRMPRKQTNPKRRRRNIIENELFEPDTASPRSQSSQA